MQRQNPKINCPLEKKKRESPIDITVTVKHDGDIVVFHASENYRFHQLLDDACHYWQRTKPSGERLPYAYLRDSFGVEWPNSELVLATLHSRTGRSKDKMAGVLVDSLSNDGNFRSEKPEIILALRSAASPRVEQSAQSFYDSTGADEADEAENTPFLSDSGGETDPDRDVFSAEEMQKWVSNEEMELWHRRSQNIRQFSLQNPKCLFAPNFSLQVETPQYRMRVVAHCIILLFHLVVLAAVLAGYYMRLHPTLLYDASMDVEQQLSPNHLAHFETREEVYSYLKTTVADAIYAPADRSAFLLGRPAQRFFALSHSKACPFSKVAPLNETVYQLSPIYVDSFTKLFGGCLMTLPSADQDNYTGIVNMMEKDQVLERSRAITISFDTFRAESKLLVHTRLVLMFLSSGSIQRDLIVSAFKPFFYPETLSKKIEFPEIFAIACDGALIIFCIFRLVWGFNAARCNFTRYSGTLWYGLDVLLFFLAITLVLCMFFFDYWYRDTAEINIFKGVTFCSPTNADNCTKVDTNWANQVSALQACGEHHFGILTLYMALLPIMMLQLLQYLQGNVVVARLWRVVRRAWPAIASFLFLYVVVQFGFLMVLNLVYGLALDKVSSIRGTAWVLLKTFTSPWMFRNFREMYRFHPILTGFLFCAHAIFQFASGAYLLGVFVHAYLETNRAEAFQRRKEPASAFPRGSLEFWNVFLSGFSELCAQAESSKLSREDRLRVYEDMLSHSSQQ